METLFVFKATLRQAQILRFARLSVSGSIPGPTNQQSRILKSSQKLLKPNLEALRLNWIYTGYMIHRITEDPSQLVAHRELADYIARVAPFAV